MCVSPALILHRAGLFLCTNTCLWWFTCGFAVINKRSPKLVISLSRAAATCSKFTLAM